MSETEATESGLEQPTPEQEAAVNGEEQTAQGEESSLAQETTEEPEATTEEPEATTEEPEATTEEPEATTEEPEATTEEPEATTEEPEATTEEPEATTEEPEATTEEPEATKQDQSETTTPQQSVPAPAVAAPKVKHDWYQTQANMCVNVMIKRLKKEDVSVEFGEQSLEVRLQLGEGQPHTLAFQLAHHVVPEKSSFKVLTTKVEIRMRKAEGLQWSTLEAPEEQRKLPQKVVVKGDAVHKYPSSSHHTRDWDKLAAEVKREEKDEKLEGDAALNKLFQQIYTDGSEEVRRAMNKSFVQSGGTVLSTNWKEVGEKDVNRKPPDGMEWRDYEK